MRKLLYLMVALGTLAGLVLYSVPASGADLETQDSSTIDEHFDVGSDVTSNTSANTGLTTDVGEIVISSYIRVLSEVTTLAATNVTAGTATLNGNIVSLGSATTANVSFKWGTASSNLTYETPSQTMTTPGAFSANLTGLTAGMVYYYRAKVVADGIAYGQEEGFTAPYLFIFKWGSQGSGESQFALPYGVDFDTSGNVYIIEYGNNRIQKFDYNGNFITMWGSKGAGSGQFNTPYDVAIDASDHVYVADGGNHRIQKFDSNGNLITTWGSQGAGSGQVNCPNGVAIDASDNIYVADTGNHRIQKFDSNGNYITKWGSYGTGDGQFSFPRGVVVDASNNVYVTDRKNNRIQKFDSNGNFIAKWGSYGSADGQFNVPTGIALDASGNIFIADSDNTRIQKFDSNGNYITKWGSYGTGDGQFKNPYDVVVDTLGNVYVVDTNNNRLQVFGYLQPLMVTTGATTEVTGNTATLNGNLVYLGSTATVNISFEWGTNSVNLTYETIPQVMTAPGAFSANLTGLTGGTAYYYRAKAIGNGTNYGIIQTFTTASGGLPVITTDGAISITANSAMLNGNLTSRGSANDVIISFEWGLTDNYTASTTPVSVNTTGPFNSSLTGLTPETIYHYRAKAIGNGIGYGLDKTFTTFPATPNVITDNVTNISGTSAVLNGILDRIGDYNSANVSFEWGITFDNLTNETLPQVMTVPGSYSHELTGLSAGTVYYFRAKAVAAGVAYGQKKAFSAPYLFKYKWGSQGSGEGQFQYPAGIAVDTLGNIYVVDSRNNRIQKFDGKGNFLFEIGSSVTDNLQMVQPWDVAVDRWGNIYVCDTNSSRIQKFDSNGNFLTKWGSNGSGNGQFLWPRGIAVDASDNVYVADTVNHRIQKFDTNGNFIKRWGSLGTGDGQFKTPNGITIDDSGNIYVSDTENHRIQKFDSNCNFVTKWGSDGSSDGQFIFPWGIAVDATDNVFVADSSNHRIQVFRYSKMLLVTTRNVTSVTDNSTFLNGNLDSLGDFSSANVSFEWGTTSGNLTHETPPQTMNAPGPFTTNLTGLTTGAVYYYRAKAVSGSIAYGQEKSFIALTVIPGDANGDRIIDALDITKIERIIVRLDTPTAGADANQDGIIDAVDLTKVERLIVHLD